MALGLTKDLKVVCDNLRSNWGWVRGLSVDWGVGLGWGFCAEQGRGVGTRAGAAARGVTLVGCPWVAHGVSMGCSWDARGSLMGCLWFAHAVSVVCPWAVRWSPMGSPWVIPWGVRGAPMGCSWVARGLSVGCPWVVVRGAPMGLPWVVHEFPMKRAKTYPYK